MLRAARSRVEGEALAWHGRQLGRSEPRSAAEVLGRGRRPNVLGPVLCVRVAEGRLAFAPILWAAILVRGLELSHLFLILVEGLIRHLDGLIALRRVIAAHLAHPRRAAVADEHEAHGGDGREREAGAEH